MNNVFALAMLCSLLVRSALLAADNPLPSVDAAQLTAFMAKWQSYQAFNFPTDEADGPLLLAALARNPAGPWSAYLTMQFAGIRYDLCDLPESERRQVAAKHVATLRSADQILAAAVQRGGTNAAELALEQSRIQLTLGPMLVEAGPAYLPEVSALAHQMIAHLPATNDCGYGDVVFAANALLGRVALREGNLAAARTYLQAAGRVPVSPVLGSFGPDYVFPAELLRHGTPADRTAVLGFLEDIAHFWQEPPLNDNSKHVDADHLQQLETWKVAIRAGKIPDDPGWRCPRASASLR